MELSSVTRSKAEAKATYDKMSRWYDLLSAGVERRYACAGLQKLNAKEGDSVLEIGFGTGHCILRLAHAVGNSGKVYGIDISEGMCNIARASVEKAELSARVKLQCGDAAALPFKDNFFDSVFLSFTLELFDTPEIPVVLRECQRVLRSGGRIGVVALSKAKATITARLYERAHRTFPKYIDCRPIFVRKALEDSGFQVIDVTEVSMVGLPVEIAVANKQG